MKEINRYRLALIQYQLSRVLPKWIFCTDKGLCFHFNAYGFRSIKYNLPILWNLQPEDDVWIYGYWFKVGELKPRIELLRKAIKIAKEKEKENLIP